MILMNHANDNDTLRDRIRRRANLARGRGQIALAVHLNLIAKEADSIEDLEPP